MSEEDGDTRVHALGQVTMKSRRQVKRRSGLDDVTSTMSGPDPNLVVHPVPLPVDRSRRRKRSDAMTALSAQPRRQSGNGARGRSKSAASETASPPTKKKTEPGKFMGRLYDDTFVFDKVFDPGVLTKKGYSSPEHHDVVRRTVETLKAAVKASRACSGANTVATTPDGCAFLVRVCGG